MDIRFKFNKFMYHSTFRFWEYIDNEFYNTLYHATINDTITFYCLGPKGRFLRII